MAKKKIGCNTCGREFIVPVYTKRYKCEDCKNGGGPGGLRIRIRKKREQKPMVMAAGAGSWWEQ